MIFTLKVLSSRKYSFGIRGTGTIDYFYDYFQNCADLEQLDPDSIQTTKDL
jgi:hypothetical protein